MLDLDMLLTIVGIALIVIGVGVFLLGKSKAASGDRSNIFEAFGIKLDVANPSVLLIMFGVVLMLAPRFVPLGDKPLAGLPMPEPGAAPTESLPEPAAPPIEAPSLPAVVQPAAEMADSAAASPAPAEDSAAAAIAKLQVQEKAELAAKAAAESRAREQAELEEHRRALAKEQAALVAERARLAALDAAKREAAARPAAPTVTRPAPAEPAAVAAPTLMILTEAINYEGETDGSLRSKMHAELRSAVSDTLDDKVRLDLQNPGFRGELRRGDWTTLCKRTRADGLLLADLTAVDVESAIESANWPNMRFSAVQCASGRVSRSGWIRMEPTVGDRFPLQQYMSRSAREFIRTNRHLLQ